MDKGRNTFRVLPGVNLNFVIYSHVAAYFVSAYEAFQIYLYKRDKRQNDKCICAKRGDI